MTQRRYGPVPATHTGVCPLCRRRLKVRPASGRMVQHGERRGRWHWSVGCRGWNRFPVPGTLEPLP